MGLDELFFEVNTHQLAVYPHIHHFSYVVGRHRAADLVDANEIIRMNLVRLIPLWDIRPLLGNPPKSTVGYVHFSADQLAIHLRQSKLLFFKQIGDSILGRQ